ncbi:uncharacterized protein METZ01_LOCUS461212, partial [marine metagenome]
ALKWVYRTHTHTLLDASAKQA